MKGYSFFELIIVLSLMSALSYFVYPSFHHWQIKNQVDMMVDDLKSAIELAKYSALDHTDFYQITADASGVTLSRKQEIVHIWPWSARGIRVRWIGFEKNTPLRFTQYPVFRNSNGHFILEGDDYQRVLHVNRVGRMS
jgi:hypothetical protein